MQVYERDTKPLLAHYPRKLVANIDATMSQLRVLRAIIFVLVPLKEKFDGEDSRGNLRPAAEIDAAGAADEIPAAAAVG